MGSSRNKFLASYGINKPQIEILLLLGGRPMSIKEIAQNLNITSGAVTQTINKLVIGGIITRTIDPLDKRKSLVGFSSNGKQRFEKISSAYVQRFGLILSNVEDNEVQSLLSITNKILTIIDKNK